MICQHRRCGQQQITYAFPRREVAQKEHLSGRARYRVGRWLDRRAVDGVGQSDDTLLRPRRNLRQRRPPGRRQHHHPRGRVRCPEDEPSPHRTASRLEFTPTHTPHGCHDTHRTRPAGQKRQYRETGHRSCRRRPHGSRSRHSAGRRSLPVCKSALKKQRSSAKARHGYPLLHRSTGIGTANRNRAACRQPPRSRRKSAGRGRSSKRARCFPNRPDRRAAKRSSSPILPETGAGSTPSHRS